MMESRTQSLTTKAFAEMVAGRRKQIAGLVPKHVDAERMLRLTVSAFQSTPKLSACVPITILSSIVHAAQLGLEFNTPMGHAYLVPFYNRRAKCMQCQLIVGYKGLLDLAYRSGTIDAVKANLVHANDEFDLDYGREPFMTHKPELKGDPGDWYAAYGMIRHANGLWVPPTVMRRDEIEKVKAMSSSKDKEGNVIGPWVDHFDAMALKTVIKRALKAEHLSVDFHRAAGLDDQAETHMGQEQVVDAGAFDGSEIDPADLNDGSDAQLEEGSKEKLEEVKQQRLIEGAERVEQARQGASTVTTGKYAYLKEFQAVKQAVGEAAYRGSLGLNGYEKSDQIPVDKRLTVLALMRKELRTEAGAPSGDEF